ncbi:MAG: hypothetical protein OEZ01_05165 [Candidatus Heimdallarchaeota archaeon]|nr:hypothetical protein [Candidatus Heimdallarchaeota archaeon]
MVGTWLNGVKVAFKNMVGTGSIVGGTTSNLMWVDRNKKADIDTLRTPPPTPTKKSDPHGNTSTIDESPHANESETNPSASGNSKASSRNTSTYHSSQRSEVSTSSTLDSYTTTEALDILLCDNSSVDSGRTPDHGIGSQGFQYVIQNISILNDPGNYVHEHLIKAGNPSDKKTEYTAKSHGSPEGLREAGYSMMKSASQFNGYMNDSSGRRKLVAARISSRQSQAGGLNKLGKKNKLTKRLDAEKEDASREFLHSAHRVFHENRGEMVAADFAKVRQNNADGTENLVSDLGAQLLKRSEINQTGNGVDAAKVVNALTKNIEGSNRAKGAGAESRIYSNIEAERALHRVTRNSAEDKRAVENHLLFKEVADGVNKDEQERTRQLDEQLAKDVKTSAENVDDILSRKGNVDNDKQCSDSSKCKCPFCSSSTPNTEFSAIDVNKMCAEGRRFYDT